MNEQELIRKLNSVGKKIFILYFDLFKSYASGKISKDKSIDILISDGVSNYSGASIRCGNAKRIFEERKECDALEIVIDSSRLSADIVSKAKKLSEELCK